MNGPLTSVIMPVYNAERFLREALDGVFALDYEPFEVIVINDGSTDRSGEIARSYPRVRYVEQENRGACAARNVGISLASGDYIAFADSDDIVRPEKLRVQIDYLVRHPDVACVMGRQHWIEEPPDVARDVVWGDPDGIPLVSMVLPRRVLLEVGDFDEDPRGDMDMLVRLREGGYEIVVLPDVVLDRRYHGDNLVAGRGLGPVPLVSLKAKLDRERRLRSGETS